MRRREQARLEATAHHEAGHAVAAFYREIGFEHVTIKPDCGKNTLGHLLHDRLPKWFRPDLDLTPRIRVRGEDHIIVCLCGQIAEAKFLGRKPNHNTHSADNQSAVDMAFRMCGSERVTQKFLDYCWAASEEFVEGRWKEIQSTAAALLSEETLSKDDVRKAIVAAYPIPVFRERGNGLERVS